MRASNWPDAVEWAHDGASSSCTLTGFRNVTYVRNGHGHHSFPGDVYLYTHTN
jgi:hypothetical protein